LPKRRDMARIPIRVPAIRHPMAIPATAPAGRFFTLLPPLGVTDEEAVGEDAAAVNVDEESPVNVPPPETLAEVTTAVVTVVGLFLVPMSAPSGFAVVVADIPGAAPVSPPGTLPCCLFSILMISQNL
jgi:hypothetical protein